MLSLYSVNSEYVEYLRKIDHKVPQTSQNKDSRPFAGIVLTISNISYIAPLTSPKGKQKKLNNNVDCVLIKDGELGAINLNNMIPVSLEFIEEIVTKKHPADTQSEQNYKELLFRQKRWCNIEENERNIIKKAQNTYKLVTKNIAPGLIKRSCNFKALEEALARYK